MSVTWNDNCKEPCFYGYELTANNDEYKTDFWKKKKTITHGYTLWKRQKRKQFAIDNQNTQIYKKWSMFNNQTVVSFHSVETMEKAGYTTGAVHYAYSLLVW